MKLRQKRFKSWTINKGFNVNILYVENNKDLITKIKNEYKTSKYEITIIDNPDDMIKFLNITTIDIDLIISEINFYNIKHIEYLQEIRKLNKNANLVITTDLDISLTLSEFSELNIHKILIKPFSIDKLKDIINDIYEKKISIQKYLNLETLNEELSSFIKPFKEFSYYSETNLNGFITDISDSFCDLVGFKKDEILGKKHSILKHPLENPLKYVEIWKNISKGKNWIGELRCKDKLSNDIWYKTIIFPKRNKNGIITGYGAKRQDITEKKYIELLSITNDLTGLYNKRFFKQTFENEKNRAKRENKNLVFIMIDVDNFKKYNDLYGHPKGDDVLKQIAEILKINSRRTNDFAFRLGGEEFAIITSNLTLIKILEYARKIKKAVLDKKIVHQANENIGFVSISMGIFNYEPQMSYSCDEIYKLADEALYKAKNSGRNKIVLYE